MNYEADIKHINSLQSSKEGIIHFEGNDISSQIEFDNGNYLLLIDKMLEFDTDGAIFSFISNEVKTTISATITAHRNPIDTLKKLASPYSECKVYSFEDNVWKTDAAFYRSYLIAPKHLIYDVSGSPYPLNLVVNNTHLKLFQNDEYIIVENDTLIDYSTFSDIKYNILVALGFVSGKFIQNEVYTFRRIDKNAQSHLSFKYRKLRKGFSSIYHAATGNPFAYEHLIGEDIAQELFEKKTLKYLGANNISKLTELIYNNHQIQYALVLFNEANSNELSLLIKNNCFFAVMEVLKKYFHSVFESKLPTDYTQKGNVDKFRIIFECLMPITEEEILTIKKRNAFMHGDIIEIEGEEMVSIMQKQITFIYRVMLTYIGFDGHIIHHYFIRNEEPKQAFVKLN